MALQLWEESEGHRGSMLGDYTYTAVASYDQDNLFFFTQLFLKC